MSDAETQRKKSWAESMQLVVDKEDAHILELARANHQLIAWWWGRRQTSENHGAYCYVCDAVVASWDPRWPMTEAAKRKVQDHREYHRSGALPFEI